MNRRSDVLGGVFAAMLLVSSMSLASGRVATGPASVRSAEGRAAFWGRSESPSVWAGGTPMPTGDGVARYAWAQCPTSPESVYVVSGVDEALSVTNNAWRFDAGTDTWNALTPIPVGQEGSSSVCWQGRIHVLGGGGTTQHYIYDIATDSWSPGAALPRPMWGAAVGAWAGSIYMVGGDSDFAFGGTSNEVNVYDIATDTWTGLGTPMAAAAVAAGSAQAGPLLYIVGGWGDSSPTTNLTVTQRYDMSTDSWSTGPPFVSGRSDLALALSEGNLYAMGGDADGGGALDATALLELLPLGNWPGGSWIEAADPLPAALTAQRSGACASVRTEGVIWSQGGFNGSAIVGTNVHRDLSEPCFDPSVIFVDGFASGDASRWSYSLP